MSAILQLCNEHKDSLFSIKSSIIKHLNSEVALHFKVFGIFYIYFFYFVTFQLEFFLGL